MSTVEQLDIDVAVRTRNAVLEQLGSEPANAPTVHAVAQVIVDNVAPGHRFSLNSIRHLLPEGIRPHGIGPTMARLEQAGVIACVSREPSTKPNTRAKTVNVYVLLHPDRLAADRPAIHVRRRAYGTGWRWRAEWPDGSIETGSRDVLDLLLAPIADRTHLPVLESTP